MIDKKTTCFRPRPQHLGIETIQKVQTGEGRRQREEQGEEKEEEKEEIERNEPARHKKRNQSKAQSNKKEDQEDDQEATGLLHNSVVGENERRARTEAKGEGQAKVYH